MSNIAAFLAMVRHSEGTDRAPDAYRVCYGYKHTIVDLSDHPAITGEWHGESLASLGPAYAGKVSTAAGAYQIIKPTWVACKAQLHLTDFTEPSQDAAATLLITQHGALALIEAGDLAEAVAKCSAEWASLPGSVSGQPQHSLAVLQSVYTQAGGMLA